MSAEKNEIIIDAESLHKELTIEGHRVLVYREISSTNTLAAHLAKCGVPDNTLIYSTYQTAGTGRFKRPWEVPRGMGITMTLLKRGREGRPIAAQLMLLAGVVVSEALHNTGGVNCGIKWPNDILIDGKKICGILAQASMQANGQGFAVIGIGININQAETNFAEDFRSKSTSLRLETGRRMSRIAVIGEFLKLWDHHYENFVREGYGYIREKWIEKNITLGQQIVINIDGREERGTAFDIKENGALLVKAENGEVIELLSEEITLGKSYYRRNENAGQ
jgi:BirA family biotin operon repressor/biotin-[acetyl-CoA-carboxylase] ligase